MIDFAIINDGYENDIAMDSQGNLICVIDEECINQMIVRALRLFLGEYEFDTTIGISWDISMEYGSTQIPLLQYQINDNIDKLNYYIDNDDLKIKQIETMKIELSQNRELTILMDIILNNNNIIGININV